MPSIAGMLSSIGPALPSTGVAPLSIVSLSALAASCTLKAMALADGPCIERKLAACPDGSILRMKLMSPRSEEHTSELQSLMRISYAVFCLKKKHNQLHTPYALITSFISLRH